MSNEKLLNEDLGPLSDNERLKGESNFLRGTIAEDLQDTMTGGFSADNFQLIRFHGMYQQDDRDISKGRNNLQRPDGSGVKQIRGSEQPLTNRAVNGGDIRVVDA